NGDGAAVYQPSVLAIDPQDTNTLYLGTAGFVGATDAGVLKSTDGGASWDAAGSRLPAPPHRASRPDRAPAPAPPHSRGVYAGLVMRCAGPVPCVSGGVFKTTDGGASWSGANSGLPGYGVTAIVIDPQNAGTIYAGTIAATPTGPFTSDGGKGIPVSSDGGIF